MTPFMRSTLHPAWVFVAIFALTFLLHAPLLQLPYFWDEAGYYVPAARDLLLTGSLIPHTTVSNAHPPLVLAWIALWWKCAGFAPLVARSAMIFLAAFSLFGLFRLAESVSNCEVAVASTICTALYPVFFAQSSLAQVDLAAAGLTFWALRSHLERRSTAAAIWFTLAALAKETAILVPIVLAGWELIGWIAGKQSSLRKFREFAFGAQGHGTVPILLLPVLPLIGWYAYHYTQTGYVFGNPEYFRYNVASTLNPLRFLLALVSRIWQVFGYMHLWVLTSAMLLAMLLPARQESGVARRRIAIPVQAVFFVVIFAYVTSMALIGGAVLARYMLTAVPLVIVLAVATLRRRLPYWTTATALVGGIFVLAWIWNPPYGFSPEDNLAYRDYIVLHQRGEKFVEARYPMASVLTAWPASDELSRPWLGYTTRPVKVVRVEDFSLDEMISAADFRSNFDVALVFSTKYDPPHPMLDRWREWTDVKRRYFGFHRDLPPAAAAQILGGHIVFSETKNNQWIAVIEIDRGQVIDARLR
jgi:Dolichyl-phosphate-mannose-protein mannosyltransferase